MQAYIWLKSLNFSIHLYFSESSDNISMKEIKGLDERLVSLQQRLGLVQQFVQDQADMAQVNISLVFLL